MSRVSQDENTKHLAALTDQLEKMTKELRKRKEEVAYWKDVATQAQQRPQTSSPRQQQPDIQMIASKVEPLLREIEKINKSLEDKQFENERLRHQFDAIQRAYMEQNQMNQQLQTNQLLVQQRMKHLEGENFQLKNQLRDHAVLQQQLAGLGQMNQQLVQQLKFAQDNTQSKNEVEQLHNNYKGVIDMKQEEINLLKGQLEADRSKSGDIEKIKEQYEREIREQKEIAREMLAHEEARVRRDEQDKIKDKIDQLTLDNDKQKNQIQQLENQLQNNQSIINHLQNELDKAKQFARIDNSFNSAWDLNGIRTDQIQKELDNKQREVDELQYQNSLLKDQIKNKIDLNVQLEQEVERLKNTMKNDSSPAGESLKIQFLLNRIEQLSKQAYVPQNLHNHNDTTVTVSTTPQMNSIEPFADLTRMSQNYRHTTAVVEQPQTLANRVVNRPQLPPQPPVSIVQQAYKPTNQQQYVQVPVLSNLPMGKRMQ